jgi:hypothetical protein
MVTPVRIAGFEKVRYVVSERAPDKGMRKALAARGVELIVGEG